MEADEAEEEEMQTKRRPWGAEEDEDLRKLVEIHGIKSWSLIATFLNARNGKQCRERWRNHLRPELNKGEWTPEEDVEIWDRVQQLGTKWAQISEQFMPCRTDNDIKNRWNSIIRKQQHPGGRDWEPEENEERARILGSASRTQVSRRSSAAAARTEGAGLPAETRERKRKDSTVDTTSHLDEMEEDCFPTEVDNENSPAQGRKLFLSPGDSNAKGRDSMAGRCRVNAHAMAAALYAGSLPSAERLATARILTPSSAIPVANHSHVHQPASHVSLAPLDCSPPPFPRPGCANASLAAQLHGEQLHSAPSRDLFGAEEIVSASFDVEPFLGMSGTVSQICSPVNEARAPSRLANTPQQHWFDHELVNSLSPILTPSLRHAAGQPRTGQPRAD
ncbi:hypothetical protein AB1Y20_018804 [Prymnesium parvum]|uniref:Uncharacterized protein n=1 Tax=Prymnesium parvum TaxID=97485 RepID=A0AB34JT65_PRYPA